MFIWPKTTLFNSIDNITLKRQPDIRQINTQNDDIKCHDVQHNDTHKSKIHCAGLHSLARNVEFCYADFSYIVAMLVT